MSNVKAGDLAIVVGPGKNIGLIVEVLSRVARGGNLLPDGNVHVSFGTRLEWITKAVGGPVRRYDGQGNPRTPGRFATVEDQRLRPLPGDTEDTTTEREVTA